MDRIWVRILHLKYKVTEICSNNIDRPLCSYVWRSIVKIWGLFRERIIQNVGNGNFVSFILDEWVPRLGKLQNYLLPGRMVASHTKVADFVTHEGCWNWLELEYYFPRNILEHISA